MTTTNLPIIDVDQRLHQVEDQRLIEIGALAGVVDRDHRQQVALEWFP
jgi:hypothetical protein